MKKKEINIILIVIFTLIIFTLIINFFIKNSLIFEINLKLLNITNLKLNYSYILNKEIKHDVVTMKIEHSDNYNTVIFKLPKNIHNLKDFYFNFPSEYNIIEIKYIKLKGFLKEYTWNYNFIEIFDTDTNECKIDKKENRLYIFNVKKYINITLNKDEFDKIKYINNSYNSNAKFIIFFSITILLFLFFYFLKKYLLNFNFNEIRRNNLVISFIFILIIFLPVTGSILRLNKNTRNIEKRTLAAKPIFNLSGFFDFPKKFSNYFDDNFCFRNNFINFYNILIAKMFSESPVPDIAIIGKKGWLYLTTEQCIDDYMGKIQFTQKKLNKMLINLQNKKAWLDKRGIKYYIFIPPDKQTIYPEFLPDNIKKINEKTKLDQIISYLKKNSDIEIIDVRDLFLKEKKRAPLFYKIDSHWNEYGSFIATHTVIKRICKDFPNEIKNIIDFDDFNIKYSTLNGSNLTFEESNYASSIGDLKRLMDIAQIKFNDDFIYFNPKKELNLEFIVEKDFKNPSTPERPLFITENKDGNLLKAVVFRDSFFPVRFFSMNFKRCVYVWPNPVMNETFFNTEIILKEKPDFVLEECCERLSYIITTYGINQYANK